MLNRRENTLLINSSGVGFAGSYTVMACPVGGVASSASSATTITMAAGHGFATGDKILVDPGGDNTFSGADSVQSVTATTIVMGSNYSIAAGDKIVNLGPDTGSSAPAYDASPMAIYSDPNGSTAVTNSTVTASAAGEYSYWHRGDGRFWELVRDSSGTVVDCIAGHGYVSGRVNVADFGASPEAADTASRIVAAITHIKSTGGNVFVPGRGITYTLDSQILIDEPNVRIYGEGSLDKTSSGASTTYVTVLDFNTTSAAIEVQEFNFTLEDIVIRAESGATTGVGIKFDNGSAGNVIFRPRLFNVAVESFDSYGIQAVEPESLVIDRCIVRLTGDAGIYITGTSGVGINTLVRDSRVHFCSGEYSVYFSTMIQTKFDGLEVLDCDASKDLVQMQGCEETTFINCDFERPSTGDGVVINKGGSLTMINNFFGTLSRGLVLTGDTSANELNSVMLINNRFASDVTTCIALDTGGDINNIHMFGNRLNGTTKVSGGYTHYDETLTTASPTILGHGTCNIDSTSNAVNAILGTGWIPGTLRTIVMTEASNSSTVSVNNHETSDPEVITFAAVDDTAVLMWTGTEWITIKLSGATV